MHPYWAIRRHTEKHTKPEQPCNMKFKDFAYTCVAVGSMRGTSVTTTAEVTIPFLTNEVEIPRGAELLLQVEEKPPQDKTNTKVEIGNIKSPRTPVKNKESRHPNMEWEKQLRVRNLWWTLRCDHIPQLRNEYKRRSCGLHIYRSCGSTNSAVAHESPQLRNKLPCASGGSCRSCGRQLRSRGFASPMELWCTELASRVCDRKVAGHSGCFRCVPNGRR